MSDRPGFFIGEEIARLDRALNLRGSAYPVDTERPCPDCAGTGLIFVSVNAWGDRISEVCKCPAGDSERKWIDREEQRLRRDELRRDIGRGEA